MSQDDRWKIARVKMCEKRNSTTVVIRTVLYPPIVRRVDDCLAMVISILNQNGIRTLSCCCGHGVHSMTIVAKIKGFPVEMFSGKRIPRKVRFYRKDNQGFYYIPEVDKIG